MARELEARSTAELLRIVTARRRPPLFADAVAELVMRYRKVVFAQALAACGRRPELAEDIFQETFVRLFAWFKAHEGMPIHSFPRLLQVFSRRAAIDLLRKEAPAPPAADPAPPPDPALGLYLQRLLETLDERAAAVMRLTYFEGRSAPEVAALLGLTPGNVRVIRCRALLRIRVENLLDDCADPYEPL